MPPLNIFASFEFDKDNELKNNFFRQAKDNSSHQVRNCSLKEAYPTEAWKEKARNAIRECDVVVILIGQDTHNAPGVRTEVEIARSLGKRVIQIRPWKRPYNGVPGVTVPIRWKWKRINRELDRIANQLGRR